MLFNSIIFIVFLIFVFTIYWALPSKYRNYFLLLSSLYFYACFNWWYLFLLIITSAVDFYAVRMMLKIPDKKKLFLWVSIGSNLLVLSLFKYGAFFLNLFPDNQIQYTWVIPVGLSFYTFQSMGYVIDVYRNKYLPKDSIYEFLLYVSFFPHMVAGPVVRYYSLMPQLKLQTFFKNIPWQAAIKLCIWGYFKKMVIADNLDLIVSPAFQHIQELNAIETIIAGFMFAVQVYCDFSGYSDIATGIAKFFNINLSLNWLRPLLSKSLKEFWQRNHISVTTWFRDYLYISMGGNRVSTQRWVINIFLTFVISGFWHGANWTFIIWGAMHGIIFLIEHFYLEKFTWFLKYFGRIYLLLFHSISLLAFRCQSGSDLKNAFSNIIFKWQVSLAHIIAFKDHIYWFFAWMFIIFIFMKEVTEEYSFKYLEPAKTRFREAFYILLVILIFILGNFHAQPFIYFQF